MENGTAVAALNGGGATQLMMDTSTTADEEMNGLDLSTKSNNSGVSGAAGPITLTISSSNGSTEGTPTPGTPINGSPEKGLEAGQISPSSLRRSTRASAIKAQQKIKDGDVPQAMDQENSVESEDESVADEKKCDSNGESQSQEPLDGESAAKKRKLENGKALDQFSHEFSIKMEDDGGVYMLDEGSELSSLNETEIETLKKCYDKLLARELTAEQKEERTKMIKQAEADLRNEEAKLTMLKKMRSSQIPKHNPVSDLQRKLAANVAANSAGAAYKPPVAGATPAAKNNALAGNAAALAQLLTGKGGAQAQQQLLALLQSSASSLMPNMTAQQKEQMMARMGQMAPQLMAAIAMQQQQQRSGQQLTKEQQQMLAAAILQQTNNQKAAAAAAATSNSSSSNSNAAASSAASAAIAAATTAASSSGTSTPSASSASANPAASALAAAAASSGATTAQKLAAARHAFRKTADGQLVTQTVMPKACPNELFFIPNPNAPDFLYMLGLDQVVGRVLKDKNAIRPTSERPYECEECGNDFATGWKAIGTKEDDLHLYCEGCLRQAQKKKLRHDRNSQLKKIYSKVALQEKEFEKQISDGKLDGMLATVFAQLQGQNAAAASAARPTAAASPAVQNLSTKPSTPSVPSPAMQKPATPLQSTPSGSKTTSSLNSSSTSSGTKRPATSNNNQQQLQTQLAQLAQLARANPMMAAAMMSGGLMGNQAQTQAAAAAAAMSQMSQISAYAPMLQQMQQMQQLQARMQQANNNSNSSAAKASASSAAASNSNSSNQQAAVQNMAMTMLAQAMQSAVSGKQNRTAASGSSNAAAASANQMAAMAQLAALSQAQSQQFGNPQQLLRQMQQLAQMQKNAAKK